MKPSIQASNIRFFNIKSNSLSVQWDNGDGDRRIVVISPEREVINQIVTNKSGSTSSFGEYGFESTYNNPNVFEVRHNFPGYPRLNNKNSSLNPDPQVVKYSCSENITYLSPYESLPIDGVSYGADLYYGNGSELFITNRGLTSSDQTLCPNPSPSPSPSPSPTPSPSYEIITQSASSNGTFVVYSGTSSTTTILNLLPSTGYYVSVFEYNLECLEYLHEPNSRFIVTSEYKESSKLTFNITDCRSGRSIISIIKITDMCGQIRDIGSSDTCGYYETELLEVGDSYKIEISAPNFDTYTFRAFLRETAKLSKSELHPITTQGTAIIKQYYTPPERQNDNHYDIKL